MKHKQIGFTIVELLIVIVVIGILAGITIVAYNGIQNRAKVASIQSDLLNNSKILDTFRYSPTNPSENYPANASAANLDLSTGNTANYYNNVINNAYCLDISNGTLSYYSTSLNTSPQQGSCTVSNGLVGWWKMNGNMSDSAGSATATITDQTLTVGQNGVASSAYNFLINPMTSSSSALPTGSAARTVLVWAYLTQYPSGAYRMASAWGTGTAGAASGLSITTAGYVTFNGNALDYSSDIILPLNQWHLIGYSVAGTQLTIIYDNQTRLATLPSSINTASGSTHYIGAWTNGAFGWAGRLDDYRIYNRVLNSTELQTIYAGGAQ